MSDRPAASADQRHGDARDGLRHEERQDVGTVPAVDRTRGGFSLWSVLSGVLVAFGAFIVISALVSGILAALGIAEGGINANEATSASIGAGVGLVIAQFLAYLWGGYTAGRMARGSGVLNGIVVPIVALVLVAILGAIVAALVANADVQAPSAQQLPLPLSTVRDIGTGVGIGLLVAMLLGGALGGWLGARWHTKLENVDAATRHDTVQ
jgi:hypothetical protein